MLTSFISHYKLRNLSIIFISCIVTTRRECGICYTLFTAILPTMANANIRTLALRRFLGRVSIHERSRRSSECNNVRGDGSKGSKGCKLLVDWECSAKTNSSSGQALKCCTQLNFAANHISRAEICINANALSKTTKSLAQPLKKWTPASGILLDAKWCTLTKWKKD